MPHGVPDCGTAYGILATTHSWRHGSLASVSYELVFWPLADEVLAGLEGTRSSGNVLAAINRTLDRLGRDPYDPRLGTRSFVTEQFGGVRATPARVDTWYILWQPGEGARSIEIILIHSIDF